MDERKIDPPKSPKPPKDDGEAPLAAALRANLRRRKTADRARDEGNRE
jgi:hypothetical protein